MSTSQRRLVLAVTVTGLLALGACAAEPGASPAPTSTTATSDQTLENASAAPPDGRVIGTGTVLDDGDAAKLCLGAIMESYPPQCTGVPLDGWSWDGVDGSETAGDVRWGTYAVYGTYDGERITVTDPPIMLALYDPVAPEDPTGGVEGSSSADDLTRVQDDISARLGTEALTVAADRGYVWLQVVWDDGALQRAADSEYGEGVVIVTSGLRAID